LAVDDAGFGAGPSTTFVDPWSGPDGVEPDGAKPDGSEPGAGPSTTFVDPWSGPDGAEPDDAGAPDGFFGFPHNPSKYHLSHSCSNSPPRFPNVVIASSGMPTTSTHA